MSDCIWLIAVDVWLAYGYSDGSEVIYLSDLDLWNLYIEWFGILDESFFILDQLFMSTCSYFSN